MRVRGGQHGQVRGILLPAALGIGRPTIDHQSDHGDDRDQCEGEDDEDLAVLASACAWPRRPPSYCWIWALLEPFIVNVPSTTTSGVDGL